MYETRNETANLAIPQGARLAIVAIVAIVDSTPPVLVPTEFAGPAQAFASFAEGHCAGHVNGAYACGR
jgi:hypothetical protein